MVAADLGAAREVEALLLRWRGKATDALLAATALLYLPVVAFAVPRRDIPVTLLCRAVITACYLAVVGAAILRRGRPRARIWVFLASAYVLIAVTLIITAGPFGKAVAVAMPVLALVLLDVPAGRAAAVISAALLLSSPLAPYFPFLETALLSTPREVLAPPVPGAVAVTQALALTGLLVTLMVPLERFYLFLAQALLSERRASDQVAQEAAERRRLEWEVARAAERERQRLGQEIHDGVCQELTGALLRSQALTHQVARGETLEMVDTENLAALLQHAIDDAHAVARGLWPLEPEPEALVRGLRALTRRTQTAAGCQCEFRAAGEVTAPDSEVAQHLYRIAGEAVSNAVRHARASRIVVELCREGEAFLLRVQDDGIGLPEPRPSGGLGLRTMAYRAQLLQGALVVEPAPEGGTRVTCRVPRTRLADPPHHREGRSADAV